jgi:hypothetical protein
MGDIVYLRFDQPRLSGEGRASTLVLESSMEETRADGYTP